MTYNETIEYLYSLQSVGIKLGLDNISQLLERLGSPQVAYRSIHIAGTNGKGSTASICASMLEAAGIKTGLFTSPHLLSFTERIRVGGKDITEAFVVELANTVKDASEGLSPTFFEVVTAMAFLHFKNTGIKWAVVETGLGGRLDSTNVLEPEVSIITPISIDHTDFLGDSLKDIAFEKAGIIKNDTPVISAPQDSVVLRVIKDKARETDSELLLCGDDFNYEIEQTGKGQITFTFHLKDMRIKNIVLPLSGRFQAMNAALAIRAYILAADTNDLDALAPSIKKGAKDTRWPGRLELVASNPDTYVDGSHNPAATATLAEELKENPLAGPSRMVLVLGVMKDKDIKGLIGPLLPLAGEIICTAPAYGRSLSAHELLNEVTAMGFKGSEARSVKDAVAKARQEGKTVLVTGSFYTAGEALEALGEVGVLTRLRECVENS
jgi:dihydrofolate synthase/folylpolyglutamate synthase